MLHSAAAAAHCGILLGFQHPSRLLQTPLRAFSFTSGPDPLPPCLPASSPPPPPAPSPPAPTGPYRQGAAGPQQSHVQFLQDKAAERVARAALLNSIRPEGAKVRSQVSSIPSVFAVLMRLRQACTHSSLLPPELRLGHSTGENSSEETQGSTGHAEGKDHSTEGCQDSTKGSTGDTEGSRKAPKGRAGKPEKNPGKAKGKQLPQSLATTLDGIQTKRGQSTKTKHVMRVIKVCYGCHFISFKFPDGHSCRFS